MSTGKRPSSEEPAWVHGHSHEPNPVSPPDTGAITAVLPDRTERRITLEFLYSLPMTSVTDCYIISTGHGASGPFTFGGVLLRAVLDALLPVGTAWRHVDVISADGFGTRLLSEEVLGSPPHRPMLLAYRLDGAPLSRANGLVRLIVPTEIDDALKQVKWVDRIEIV